LGVIPAGMTDLSFAYVFADVRLFWLFSVRITNTNFTSFVREFRTWKAKYIFRAAAMLLFYTLQNVVS